MNNATGCIFLVIIALALSAALVWGLSDLQDSAADYETARGNAEAAIIRSQGQAALDRAEARSVVIQSAALASQIYTQATISKMSAGLPWAVLAVLGILGLAVVALAFVAIVRPRQDWSPVGPPQIIERQVVYFPTPADPPALTAPQPVPEKDERKTVSRVIYL